MAVTQSVQEFLRRANVTYSVCPHPAAYTAADEADVMDVAEREWAKVVVCFADKQPIQAVVPANYGVDLDQLTNLTGAKNLRLAHEDELKWLFPDCELGAMPPFGPLYHQRVYVDESLTKDENIVFNAGTHRDAVVMSFADFEELTSPVIGRFGRRLY